MCRATHFWSLKDNKEEKVMANEILKFISQQEETELCNAIEKLTPKEQMEKINEIRCKFIAKSKNPKYNLYYGYYMEGVIIREMSDKLFALYTTAYANSLDDDEVICEDYVYEHREYLLQEKKLWASFLKYVDFDSKKMDDYFRKFLVRVQEIENAIASDYFNKPRPSWYDDNDFLSQTRFLEMIDKNVQEVMNEQLVYTTSFPINEDKDFYYYDFTKVENNNSYEEEFPY